MAIYIYKAMDAEGNIVGGKSSARGEDELASRLREAGLEILSCQQQKANVWSPWNKVSLKELILICVHIHQLDKAGVSILDSIADLRDNSDSPIVRTVMMDIHEGLKNGKSLSTAMAEHPNVFDNLFISLVEASEKTGSFADAFEHLETHLRWVLALRNKIKGATYYPIFLFLLMIAVTLVMMTYVVPKLTVFLVAQNISLPFYTLALMAFSNFILNYWYLVISVPIITYIGLQVGCAYFPELRKKIDLLKLRTPWLGPLLMKVEMARFCRFFGVTYKSGMGVLDCLYTAGNVVGNTVIREHIDSVAAAVGSGAKLTSALKNSKQFPSIVIRMFEVGEESGAVDSSLKHVNEFYDAEINESIDSFIGILQPALTIFMGLLLLWITISVFGPVYSSFGAMR
ncbi:MAG: type II secretion system F family protein [Proteobacteria bacterium]|nr:type II secretion system F family protein [Pseudomonadota bacterium]